MSVVIRPMQANDHAALIELKWELNRVEIATMPDGHPLKADRDPSRAAAERGVAAYLTVVRERDGEILVADNEGEVVGSIVWHPDAGSPSVHEAARQRAMISGFVLHASQRGKGVGQQLLAEVEQRARARGLHRLILSVVAWNEASIAFYEARGFVPLEILMMKPLQPTI